MVNFDWANIALGAGIGTAATWFFAWLYYAKAKRESELAITRLEETIRGGMSKNALANLASFTFHTKAGNALAGRILSMAVDAIEAAKKMPASDAANGTGVDPADGAADGKP